MSSINELRQMFGEETEVPVANPSKERGFDVWWTAMVDQLGDRTDLISPELYDQAKAQWRGLRPDQFAQDVLEGPPGAWDDGTEDEETPVIGQDGYGADPRLDWLNEPGSEQVGRTRMRDVDLSDEVDETYEADGDVLDDVDVAVDAPSVPSSGNPWSWVSELESWVELTPEDLADLPTGGEDGETGQRSFEPDEGDLTWDEFQVDYPHEAEALQNEFRGQQEEVESGRFRLGPGEGMVHFMPGEPGRNEFSPTGEW